MMTLLEAIALFLVGTGAIYPVGLFAQNTQTGETMARHIVLQPADQTSWVSSTEGVFTLFQIPEKSGVTALLAHNFAAEDEIKFLRNADEISIIYGDGTYKTYHSAKVEVWEAQDGKSEHSWFRLPPGDWISAFSLYHKIYGGDFPLVIQTCKAVENLYDAREFFLYAAEVDDGD